MQGGPWQEAQRQTGVMACVAVPLTRGGRSVGVLLFFVSRSWAADEEVIALLARIAENVSFALDNFERADEKARADQQQERLTRMFAALSATNEAIMRAKSRTELHELVCEAAASGGRFNSTSILLARPDSDYPDMMAVAGPTAANMRRVKVSFNAAHPEGHGLCGNAFRSGQACIANDLRADPRGTTFQKFIFSDGAKAGAAFPLFVSGEPVGVMFFISADRDTFTPEFAELLQRLADNVSFALESFDRADEKAKTDGQKERLARMFAALSATNEAIMRARSRSELFELVCEAAAQGGKFTSTSIALIRPDSDYLDVAGAAGPTVVSAREVKLSVNDAHPEGRGVGGTAIRSRRPSIINDYLADPRSQAFHARARNDGANSGAAFPLFVQGRAVGVMVFISLEKDTFTPEFAELLQRLADNVSFALENFDRADEKARTEEQKERLTRMFAALSATNEAIMRAKSRTELFDLVCAAAATGGKFTSTTIALAKARQRLSRHRRDRRTGRRQRTRRQNVDQRGAPGRARRRAAWHSARARPASSTIISPIRAARRSMPRRARMGRNPARRFRCSRAGRWSAFIVFVATEKDTFTPEFAELLQRLADNVSFALENFDRVDEKAQADQRIEYLASHDSLTNLPNREMFNGMLRRAIDAAQRYERRFAVLFIDLDRFKVINDSLGHDAGDMLLVEIGGRLRDALRVERRRGAARRRRIRRHPRRSRRTPRRRTHRRRAVVRAQPAAAAERPRMPHHGLDRHRDVSVRRCRTCRR